MRAQRDGGFLKILFIHPFGIGDVIFSLAAAEALARRGHTVDYLCNERTEDLLKLCPTVRKTHRFDRSAIREEMSRSPFRALARYNALRRQLGGEGYDLALDFSMGREYSFLAWTAGIRRRIGWDYKRRGRWLTGRVVVDGFDERSPRDYAMDLARLADAGVSGRPVYPQLNLKTAGSGAALAEADRWADARVGAGPRIVLAPGGGESWGKDAHFKQWPQEAWIDLARKLIRDTRARIVIVGSKSEEPLVAAVAAQAAAGAAGSEGRAVAVAGENLDRVIALIAGARAFVGTDGGLLHLANLTGTPALGLYGPVSERGYGPLESASPSRVLTAQVPCRPCYQRFRFTGCSYEKRCLTQITPDRAAEELRSLLTADSL